MRGYALICGPGVNPSSATLATLRELATPDGLLELVSEESALLLLTVDPRLVLARPLLARRGSLALLHAALLCSRSEAVVVLDGAEACPEPALLRGLAIHPARGNVLLPEGESPGARRSQVLRPFPGRYRRGCLRLLRKALQAKQTDLLELGPLLRATRVPTAELAELGARQSTPYRDPGLRL